VTRANLYRNSNLDSAAVVPMEIRPDLWRFVVRCLIVACAAVLVQPLAVAQTVVTWSWTGGGGNGNWSNQDNWSSQVLPSVSSTMSTIRFVGNTQTVTNNDRVSMTGTFNFANNGSTGSTSGFTLSGSAVTLRVNSGGFAIVSSTLATGASPITDTINLDVQLDTFSGSTQFWAVQSGRELVVNGKITSVANSRGISKRERGTLTLTNTASTFASFSAAEGMTRTATLGTAGSPSPLGTGTFIGFGSSALTGTLAYTGGGETTNKWFSVQGNGSGAFENNGSGPLVFTSGTAIVNATGSTSRSFTLAGANTSDNNIQGIIADVATSSTLSLRKSGSGFWKLSGANTYTGSTAILGGRLTVAPTGSLVNTSTITIDGSDADFRWNSATTMDRPLTFTRGTISGTGAIGVAVTAGANRVLSPGNSPGNQPYTAGLTLASSGTYVWEIASGTGSKGVNWDLITVSGGALNLATLSSGSSFNLNLVTLSGTAAGAMANYTAGNAYRWRIFDATSLTLPSSFNSFLVTTGTYADFTDVTSLFTLGTNGWQNGSLDLADVKVEVADDGTGLDLVIVGVVPEPSTLVLAAAGIAAAGWRCRRRRSGITT
jgi:fibronectin-binding autotransporter adhesin